MKTKNIFPITIGFILILFGSVWTLTRQFIWSSWDLTNSGQIGDTIGGITAPIINTVGSFLIFISFLAQNKANKIQSNQNSFELLNELYKDLKEDFNNLNFSSSSLNDGKIYYGQKALSVFTETLEKRVDKEDFKKNSFFDELLFLLGSAKLFLDIVENSKLDETEKIYILRLFHFMYLLRLDKHLEKIIMLTNDKERHSFFNKKLLSISEKVTVNHDKYLKKQ